MSTRSLRSGRLIFFIADGIDSDSDILLVDPFFESVPTEELYFALGWFMPYRHEQIDRMPITLCKYLYLRVQEKQKEEIRFQLAIHGIDPDKVLRE